MKKPVIFFLMLFLAVCLGYGIIRLFMIRFAQGDIYAPCSTLRADELGAKALHDSLAELMPVERNFKPLSELHPEGANSTIFVLGVPYGFEEDTDAADLETLAQEGNRVVLAFLTYRHQPPEESPTPAEKPENSGTNGADKKADKKADKSKLDNLQTQWGEKTAFSHTPFDRAKTEIPGLEPKLSWHGAMYFDKLDPIWRTLYSCAGKPVVIERALGRGSLVLISDAYFSSNEALNKERAPGLISALVGNANTVIFDETHLGVSEHPGVATLVRKYQLHDVVLALAFVAALFVWRNAVAFVPRGEEEAASGDIVRGFGATAGFISLLKRNIPLNKLVETCVAEWKRSFGHRAKPELLARVEAQAGAGGKQPVETFQMITQAINEKK